MPKDRKPIYVKDKNDPRLLGYIDSLASYNWGVNDKNNRLKTGKSPKGYKLDLSLYKGNTISPSEFVDNKFNELSKLGVKITKKEVEENRSGTDTYNRGSDKLNKAISYSIFPFENNKGSYESANYKKPVQPYIYKPEEISKINPSIPINNIIKKDSIQPLYKSEPIKPKNDNTTQIETLPNYKVKYTKDNTGKIINEDYYNFDDKPIKKLPYGGTYGDDIDQKASRAITKIKLTPKQWDQQNSSLGYQPTGFGNNSYKEYYNPNEYFKDDKGGFTKLSDKGKTVDYTNDTTYKPTIKYIEPGIPDMSIKKKPVNILDPMKQVGFNGQLAPITQQYSNGGIKKFKGGGFLTDVGDFLLNDIKSVGDIGLSAIGLGNVIGQDDYKGKSAHDFQKISNIGGSITSSILPVAAGVAGGAFGGPAGAKLGFGLAKGVQGIGNSINPQDAQGGNNDYMNSMKTGRQVGNITDQIGNFAMMGMGSGLFPNGGINTSPNSEVELQENSIAPNGEFTQYNGPSHEHGGIPTNLDKGEIVFSDRLKPKGSKKTFADLNKPYNTNKEDKLIEDKKSNNLQKITAQLMKEAKMKQSIALFQDQENLKHSKVNNYAKKLGVDLDDQSTSYKNGGIHIKPSHVGRFTAYKERTGQTTEQALHSSNPHVRQMANFARNASHWKHENGGIHKYDMGGGEGNPQYGPQQLPQGIMGAGYNPDAYNQAMQNVGSTKTWSREDTSQSTSVNTNNNISNTNQGFNWQNAAMQLGQGLVQNVGNLYDLGRSSSAQVEKYNRVTPNTLDPTAALKYNDMQGRMANESIRNASQGNASTYLNNRKDLAINQMMSNANIRNSYDNQNANIRNQANYYNAQTGDRETIANLQNQAQSRNIKSSALSSIGQNLMGQYVNNKATNINNQVNQQLSKRDQDYLKIIANRYPEIMKDPNLSQLFKQ